MVVLLSVAMVTLVYGMILLHILATLPVVLRFSIL